MHPPQLQAILDRSLTSVHDHATHALKPIYRAEVYTFFGAISQPAGYLRHTTLALTAARHVQLLWNEHRPDDKQLERLLALTEGVLSGTTNVDQMQEEREKATKWLHEYDVLTSETFPLEPLEERTYQTFGEDLRQATAVNESVPDAAYFSLLTAVAVGVTVLGSNPYEGMSGSDFENYADAFGEVLELGDEAALSASCAYAGNFWKPSKERRLHYWTWWLTEAVPASWNAAEKR